MAIDREKIRLATQPSQIVDYLKQLFKDRKYSDVENAIWFYYNEVAEVFKGLSLHYLVHRIPAFVVNEIILKILPTQHLSDWEFEFPMLIRPILEKSMGDSLNWRPFIGRFQEDDPQIGIVDYFVFGIRQHNLPLPKLIELLEKSVETYKRNHGI